MMKKLLILCSLATALFFVACDETESPVFDPESGETLAFFNTQSSNLEVIVDDEGSVDIPVGFTTLSDQDRNITVEVVNNEEMTLTTAAEENYTIPESTVTVPAGEFFANVTVVGVDNSVELTEERITLEIVGTSEGIIDDTQHTISIFQICPLETTDFVGSYMLEQLTPDNPDDGGPVFNDQVVTLEVVEGASTQRQFSAVYLEFLGIGQPPSTVPFALSCDQVITAPNEPIGTGLVCVQGDPAIMLDTGEEPGTFDIMDDSVLEITMLEYSPSDGGCGASPYPVTFRLTKQ